MGTKTLKTPSISEQITTALDGRTQRWLAIKTSILEDSLSRKLKGKMKFTDDDLKAIEEALNFKIKK